MDFSAWVSETCSTIEYFNCSKTSSLPRFVAIGQRSNSAPVMEATWDSRRILHSLNKNSREGPTYHDAVPVLLYGACPGLGYWCTGSGGMSCNVSVLRIKTGGLECREIRMNDRLQ